MMKMFYQKFLSALALILVSGLASAMPTLDFDIDGPGSSVSTITDLGVGSMNAVLVGGLDAEVFSLMQGQSHSFDFFTAMITAPLTAGFGTINATLAFDTPASSAVGSGGTLFTNIFGVVTAGAILWDASLPATINLADGSIFQVDFQDVVTTSLQFNVQATVTALRVANRGNVPEPGVLLLLAIGLVVLRLVLKNRETFSAGRLQV